MLSLNNRLNNISPSLIRELKEKANQFEDVIDFTLGEPHLYHVTYDIIKNGLDKKMESESLGYPNFLGVLELKKAVSNYCKIQYQQAYNSETEVLITSGCSEGLRAVLETILNEKDEAIVFEPAFSLYQSMTKLCGGVVVTYNLHETDFKIEEDMLLKCISDKTKVILLNSPHNPSGHVFKEEDMSVLKKVIKEKQLFVIVDEIYRDLIYNDKTFASLSDDVSLRDQLFIVNGFSKSFAMTGWRVGYVLGPSVYMKSVGIVHQNLVSCGSVVSQYAAIEAMKHPEITHLLKEYYKENKNLVIKELSEYFEEFIEPEGGFYFYAKVPQTITNSLVYANSLLIKAKVAVVPSVAFQTIDTGYIRISYCCKKEVLMEGLSRIKSYNHTELT